MIPFTRRELKNAWRDAGNFSKHAPRGNPHKLMLFYAVECGLKAVYLKRLHSDVIDSEIAHELKHDINKIMDKLLIGNRYLLPMKMNMSTYKKNKVDTPRNCQTGDLNQVWRYGGTICGIGILSEESLILKLESINEWVAGEI